MADSLLRPEVRTLWRRPVGLLGVLLAAAGLASLGPLFPVEGISPMAGPVAAVALLVAWALLSAVVAVAVGTVALTVVAPPLGPLAVVLLGFGLVAIEPLRRTDTVGLAVASLLASLTVLGTVAVLAATGPGLPVAVVALAATGALLVYGVHRYELVAMGLVEDDA